MSNLRKIRKDRGLSQAEVASMLEITQATFSGWETEKFEIDKNSLVRLADIFNVSTDFILGRTNPIEEKYFSIGDSLIKKILQLNTLGKEKAESYILDLLDNPKYVSEEHSSIPSLEEAMRLQKGTPLRTDRLGHDDIIHKAAFGGGVWEEKKDK